MAGLKKKSSATASFTGISEASSSKRKRKSKSKKRDSLEPSGSKLDESYYNDDSSKISMEQVSETSMVEDQVESGSIRPRNKLSGKESNVLENSTLKFTDINFLVGKKDNKKHILTNVSGEVKHGHVLAIMGPSGAGKTTLISVLTLDAFYGTPAGNVTLNGFPLTGDLFKTHCFIVKQHDKHWPYLTARESLQYSAGLFNVSTPENIPLIVDSVLEKMGLGICADTPCARLSGGQKRRLSIAVALLKQPTVLFLDEPTSGLDAAAASNIMEEITRVAKAENIIVVCTIHQPSTKVYNGFDQVMILSRGREAFTGDVHGAAQYFGSIGYPLPDATNPAEHFLDLVNSDFSGEEEVKQILDEWENRISTRARCASVTEQGVIEKLHHPGIQQEGGLMVRRHLSLILRDPILYAGRGVITLVMNLLFAFVYWNARENVFDQVFNKVWIQLWFVSVPMNMGVVAVYALNDEFKAIQREHQNGMSRASTYLLAKSLLVLPILFAFAIAAMVIPAYVIQANPWSTFGLMIILYATIAFVFESVAETLSVLFVDPILGMLCFMMFWFACFLFGGFLIPLDDMTWPFKAFYYILPFGYYMRSAMYLVITETDWEQIPDDPTSDLSNVEAAIKIVNAAFPLIENEDRVWQDIFTLLAMGVFWKLVYISLFITTTKKVASIQKSV